MKKFDLKFELDLFVSLARTKWWMLRHRNEVKQAIRLADDLWRRKGSQHHVIKVGDELMVVDNRWRKNYNKLMKKRTGGTLDYTRLRKLSIYSTR